VRPISGRRAAIVLQPSTLVRLHRALVHRKYRRLFSSTRKTPGPKGPHPDVIAAVVAMKQRNPTWGCPRIAQQIAVAFGISLDKDVVRRILAARYRLSPDSAGPSWLTTLGHAKDSGVLMCSAANRPRCRPARALARHDEVHESLLAAIGRWDELDSRTTKSS